MRPTALLSTTLLLALACAGCADGDDSASRETSTTTVTASPSPTIAPTTPTSTATPPPSPTESAASCPEPFDVAFTSSTEQVAGVTATLVGVTVSTDCARGASVLQYAVRDLARARFDAWSAQWTKLAAEYPDGPKGEFEQKASVAEDVDGLGVVTIDTYVFSGGAHGNALRDVRAVNSRTGEEITVDSMLAEMQQAGGPNWDFERELRRSAVAAVPAYPVTDLTREAVSAYPTKDGLAVSLSQGAYFATAQGVVEFTIGWDRLVGDGEDLSFVPDQWGH